MAMRTRRKGTSRQQALRIQEQTRLYSLIPGYLSYSRASPYTFLLYVLVLPYLSYLADIPS